jgi:hypothetical protein
MGIQVVLLMALAVSVALNVRFVLNLRGHKGEERQ